MEETREGTRIGSEEELADFADSFLQTLERGKGANVVGLSGELGAGKTAFVKALAKRLGITETVQSPTFVIMKTYPLSPATTYNLQPNTLIHIDAYRLESGEELAALGFRELCGDTENFILIEWPENVADVLPDDMTTLRFEIVDEKTRTITYA